MEPRILVVQTAFLGDVVLTTPLFRALKRVRPRARLSALVTPVAAPLLEADPHLDGLLTYDKKGGDSLVAVARRLKQEHFDWLVAPHRSFRTGFLALLSGVAERVGFSDASFPWAFNHRVVRPQGGHEVDRNLSLLRGLGEEPHPEDRVLHVGYTTTEKQAVEAVLREAEVLPGEQLAALCPGSVWQTKRWTAEGFAGVAQGLLARGMRPVLLGAQADAETARQVAQLSGLGPRLVNAVGRTSLKALAAWMDRVRVLVTNDSAPLHVAAARGTPTVVVFGATSPSLGFGPFHAASRVVEASLECRPCGLHGARQCPEKHFRCMLDVPPSQVLAALDQLLGSAA